MNNQTFVYYAGLWGSPSEYSKFAQTVPSGTHPVKDLIDKLVYISSGYWGPAFNETGEQPPGFIRAWCFDMLNQSPGECTSK